jgi:periplasmic protein TonB
MYANRYDDSWASRPVSAGAALLINGGLIAGLLFAGPEIVRGPDDDTLITRNIPNTPPPPPIDPEPPQARTIDKAPTTPPLSQPEPRVPTIPNDPGLNMTRDPVAPPLDPPMGPSGAGTGAIDPPALPVLVDASIDSRFAGNFQPDYPGSELRQEKEGLVKVRVLIGVDGRIKAVEQLASPTAGFFEATRRHALNKWRFKPATRDGIPVESWKVMTVRFRITT